MLTEERHAYILERLKADGIVKSQQLMEALHCSEATIRRDLQQLSQEGLLKRIHGGAKRIYQVDEELSNIEKTVKNVQEKTTIGKLASSLIGEQDVIYLDAGTTTAAVIPFLKEKNITVVTNGVQHASLLADHHIRTYLLGGEIKHSTKAIIGAGALSGLANYRFDKVFLGMNGIDLEFGCTTPDLEEASLKKLAHQQSALTYVLADHTKWNKVNFTKVCDIDEVTIITDSKYSNLDVYKEKTDILEAQQ
ncbi:DeoR/GlpR family DNA-binding transcription regulator [Lentibacillus sediminis]|uniref:DeoR/GlpR family DNA-binding transcription regulator n=1 Tax=Lentibacillus sediminis TaxID=1940529 RepID=UPI000C1BF4F7|nr:DeoR/GlpR family DNA-binding transcription regulator [Lentibacillus sediminis]